MPKASDSSIKHPAITRTSFHEVMLILSSK